MFVVSSKKSIGDRRLWRNRREGHNVEPARGCLFPLRPEYNQSIIVVSNNENAAVCDRREKKDDRFRLQSKIVVVMMYRHRDHPSFSSPRLSSCGRVERSESSEHCPPSLTEQNEMETGGEKFNSVNIPF